MNSQQRFNFSVAAGVVGAMLLMISSPVAQAEAPARLLTWTARDEARAEPLKPLRPVRPAQFSAPRRSSRSAGPSLDDLRHLKPFRPMSADRFLSGRASRRDATRYVAGRTARVARQRDELIVDPAPSAPEEIRAEPLVEEGPEIIDYFDDESDVPECGPEECGYGFCEQFFGFPCEWAWWENLSFFGGFHGFKGPVDRVGGTSNGNFGVHEGLNYALPASHDWGVGIQAGVGFYQSDFTGSAIQSDGSRDQIFFTGGLFHRTTHGWQGGVVFDSLHDEFYLDADVSQLRGELSWVNGMGGEWGFTAAIGTRDDTGTFANVRHQWKPIDQYAVFFRTQLSGGGDARILGGWTDNGDGIIGAEALVPLNRRFALGASGNFLIPGTSGPNDFGRESWGLRISLVWYPGLLAASKGNAPYRPLFNVADNGTFFLNRRTR